ncbi:hypothetical protein E3P89_00865 [Wallemia ichthyophaga]|uniref:Ras GTPase-activating-like protein rng2 n=1 Tax=Wallemia ichthyophaga TaxID=245174 RepID=A0A4T0IAU6_WALIC|nr:hypothetical protein E3P90_01160 [Wallemia ichthyophaga]TIB16536.1 hypothetical protein E3P93_00911 [Wallemia ichthyophaga]TIB24648.1 hypothetical protein E3P89_00865 [Wallemia ichthyophaga]TIB26479.1 hypothetical protein E3P88_01029 [Wallemia ichthyophaga]
MHDFTKSLNNREKLLLCQYINEHNFNWNLIPRSLSSHPLLLSRSPGFFTSDVGTEDAIEAQLTVRRVVKSLITIFYWNWNSKRKLRKDAKHFSRNSSDNTKYSKDLQSRPQLKLAKKYFKLHVDEIKQSIWQQERDFRAVLQDLHNMKNNQAETSQESSTRKEASPRPPIHSERDNQEPEVLQERLTSKESASREPNPKEQTPEEAVVQELESEPPLQIKESQDGDAAMNQLPEEHATNDSNTNDPEEATPREPDSPAKEVIADTPKSSEDMQVDMKPEEVRETRRTSKRKSAAVENTNKRSPATPNETPEDTANANSKRRKSTLDDTQRKTQKVLLLCLQDITTHKAGIVFEQPIRANEAPGYHDVVYSPTDLTTIKRKIRDGQITSAQQFKANVLLMFANSIMYNPPSSDVHEMAQEQSTPLASPKPTFLDGISHRTPSGSLSRHKSSHSVGDVASKWEARSQSDKSTVPFPNYPSRSPSPTKSSPNKSSLPSSVFTPFSHGNHPPSPTPEKTPSIRRSRPLSLQSTPDLAKSSVGALKELGSSQSVYRTNSLSRARSIDLEAEKQKASEQPSPTKSESGHSILGRGPAPSYRAKSGAHLGRITSGDAENDWDENDKPGGWDKDQRSSLKDDSFHLPGITDMSEQVVGLPGRVRLSRTGSLTEGSRNAAGLRRTNAVKNSSLSPTRASQNSSVMSRTQYMTLDKQRHLLAAYEYLCHISEAIRWIEDCLEGSLEMDEVQAEDGLRDGIVLFRLASVWGFGEGMEDGHIGWNGIRKNYTGNRRLFMHPNIRHFKYVDNINYFFEFIRRISLPELFTFETTDLYEKKNIPKVIYCLHALSYLLAGRGVAPRIGALKGQLEFTDDQLRQTQKNLDASNVPMPNFGGLASTFGDPEPIQEPEPVESEEDRIARELFDVEGTIVTLQAQARGYLTRLQVSSLKIKMKLNKKIITVVQARCRGKITRSRLSSLRERRSGSAMKWVVPLQAIARQKLVRDEQKDIKKYLMICKPAVTALQAQARGLLSRKKYVNKLHIIYRQNRTGVYQGLQAQCRGLLAISSFRKCKSALNNRAELQRALLIQSSCRGYLVKSKYTEYLDSITEQVPVYTAVQAACRSKASRSKYQSKLKDVMKSSQNFVHLQAHSRGIIFRRKHRKLNNALKSASTTQSVVSIQSHARALIVRQENESFRAQLESLFGAHVKIQACSRGANVRDQCESILAYLDDNYKSIISVQSLSRTKLIHDRYNYLNSLLEQSSISTLQLQSQCRGFLVRKSNEQLKAELSDDSKLSSICQIQSLGRATLVRRSIWNIFQELESMEGEIVKCQAQSRGCLIRKDQTMWKRHLQVSQPQAVNLQSVLRAYVQRQKFGEKKTHYRANKEKIVKVQALYRGKEKREQFKELTMGNNVPLNTVKEFVHLLDDSDYDFDEEIELVDVRKKVLESIRETQALESHVDELDVKIALVVKNALSFDELVRAAKGRTVASSTLNRNGSVLTAAGDPFSPGKMDKQTIRRLELYQQLFWRLQNQPEYLARLFYNMSRTEVSDKNRRLIENVIMTLFGYTQSAREEYLFLKVMQRSMHEEIASARQLSDVVRGSFTWVKMFLLYLRGPERKTYLKQALGPRISEITSLESFDLETDPVIIWKQIINYQELESGKPSDKKKDVTYEEAISDSDTRVTFIHHLQQLRHATEHFRGDIQKSTKKMPYGLRFIARELYLALRIKFKNESEEACNRIIGQLIYYRYIQPAIVTPETFDVVPKVLDPLQRKNLNEIAKMLTQLAMGEVFSDENTYLTPLNDYIMDASSKFIPWFGQVADAVDAETYFNAGEFLEYNTTRKPSIHISPSEIYDVHSLLNQNLDRIAPTREDPLRAILLELGGPPLPAQGELYEARKRAISLTLTNRNTQVDNPNDPQTHKKQLWLQTKRLVLAVLRIQPERTLTQSFISEVTKEHEAQWQLFVQKEALIERSRITGAGDTVSPFLGSGYKINDIRQMNYTEVKARAIEYCLQLEKIGEISRKDNYQSVLNAIAVDVRSRNRKRIQRQKELSSMENTLKILEEKKEYLLTQQDAFNSYIETSMQTMQKKGKKRFVLPFTKQWSHLRDLKHTGKKFKFGSYKYAAQELYNRGLLLSISQVSPRQYDGIFLTFSSDEIGVFKIDLNIAGEQNAMASEDVRLEDMLQMQFENKSSIAICQGNVKCNLNVLLFQLYKK